jgi:ABC-type transporter Mla MlaB component
MLKITRLSRKGRRRTLKLEGQLLEPWVSTVRDACTQVDPRPEHLCLDLDGITYVDAAGIQLLCDLLREGVAIAACSRFIDELLHLEDWEKPGAGGAPESSPPASPSDRP